MTNENQGGEMGGGDVIATVEPERWDHPAAPQIAYSNGWNDRSALSPSEQPEPVARQWRAVDEQGPRTSWRELDWRSMREAEQWEESHEVEYRDLYAQPSEQTGGGGEGEMFGVTGAADEVEALACAIWAHRCPGLLMDEDDDRPHYMEAARAAFAALGGSQ